MATLDLNAYRGLVDALRHRASADVEQEVGVPLGPRLDDSLTLAQAGEVAISIENLLANLHEYDVVLTPNEHRALTGFASASGASPDALGILRLISVEAP